MAVPTWRVPFQRRMFAPVLAVAAEAVAIAIVITGPRESLGFSLRLPLLVLAAGALLTAARWRRAITPTPEEIEAALPRSPDISWYAGPPPVPMATPWLVLNSSAGVAFLAAKGYENHPALVASLLGIAGLAGLVALGGCLLEWLRAR